jgi:hypothetical protein
VPMVRRRSTVRFRKGAPGRENYSNVYPVTVGAPGGISGALPNSDHGLSCGMRCADGIVSVSGFRNLDGPGSSSRHLSTTLSVVCLVCGFALASQLAVRVDSVSRSTTWGDLLRSRVRTSDQYPAGGWPRSEAGRRCRWAVI